MKIVFILQEDVLNKKTWSGTPYYLYMGLKKKYPDIKLLSPLHTSFTAKVRRKITRETDNILFKIFKKRYLNSDMPKHILKNWSKQVDEYIKTHKNYIVISTSIFPFVYSKMKYKMIQITDATPALLINDYQKNVFSNKLRKKQEEISLKVTNNTMLIVTSSDWCRHSVINDYKINKNKVITMPFGSNFENKEVYYNDKTIDKNKEIIFLFVGKFWKRKGLDLAISVLDQLKKMGYKVRYNVIGCKIPDSLNRNYINNIPFLNKNETKDRKKLINFFKTSHFYFMPSRAEAFGIVFAEAAAFGLPVIATNIGGIPSVVDNSKTGILLDFNDETGDWAQRIAGVIENKTKYEQLSKSARKKFKEVLNWDVYADSLLNQIRKINTDRNR